MTEPFVLVDRSDLSIWRLALNRPAKRNALSIELMTQLCAALEDVASTPGVRAVILSGQGPVFCAGLDLDEAGDPSKTHESAALVRRTIAAIYACPAVTIAAAHGAAVAGGAGLISACDFVLASPELKVGYPEVHRGLVAALVMTLLRRQVRERDLRELLILGEIIDAPRAQEIGLVNRIVPATSLLDEAAALARKAARGAPGAIRITKRILADLWPRSLEADLDIALSCHEEVRESAEAAEGRRAFKEKRDPIWPIPGR